MELDKASDTGGRAPIVQEDAAMNHPQPEAHPQTEMLFLSWGKEGGTMHNFTGEAIREVEIIQGAGSFPFKQAPAEPMSVTAGK